MIVYNTTFHSDGQEANHLLVYLHEVWIPAATATGLLSNPRLMRVLSHQQDDTQSFSLQFEVADTTSLHTWYVGKGQTLHAELQRLFRQSVQSFSTILEIIE